MTVEAIEYREVAYVGIECRLCGCRNIAHSAMPGQIDRVALDVFVGWMTGEYENIQVDATGDLTWWRSGPKDDAVLGIRRGPVRLVVMHDDPRPSMSLTLKQETV